MFKNANKLQPTIDSHIFKYGCILVTLSVHFPLRKNVKKTIPECKIWE